MTRTIGWIVTGLAAVLVLAPLAALGIGTVVDYGPAGAARGSILYVALTALDPFVWTCLWNSLSVAIAITFGSWLIGVALARAVEHWRFWGRGSLWMLSCVPVTVLPLFAAIGLRTWLARMGPWATPAAWLAWVWVGLSYGVPIVALATRAALRRIDPVWEDAARLAGATRRQIWWTIAWPVARLEAARAVTAVFTLTLLEPGAPLVLGLRRTLAYQVVDAAMGSSALFPRAGCLALWSVALAAIGRLLIGWWSHVSWPVPPPAIDRRPCRAGFMRGLALCGVLAAWNVFALAPLVSLAALSLTPSRGSTGSLAPLQAFVDRVRADGDLRRLAAVSVALGAGAATMGLILAASVAGPAPRRNGRWGSALRRLAVLPEAVPPLALAVGAMLIPVLLVSGSGRGPYGLLGHAGYQLAGGLDPYTMPGVLLVVCLAVFAMPRLAWAVECVGNEARPQLAEAARTLGASGHRARISLFRLWLGGAPLSAWLVSTALAATSLVPAILLAPTSEARPLAPVILLLADQPGSALLRAADLAMAAVALNLVAFGLAARRRAGPVGAWFRG